MKRKSTPNVVAGMSVLLVEDAALVRQRLRALMEEAGNLRVVAEAATVAEAITLFDSVSPEAVVLDLALPDGSGLDVLRHIRKAEGKCLVLVLSNHAGPDVRHCCRTLGADFVFGKSDEFEQALETLRIASRRTDHRAKGKRKAGQVHRAQVVVTDSAGLHARPAVVLIKHVMAFDSDIHLSNAGRKANAKSIMSVLTLGAVRGAVITLTARGEDAEEAVLAITALFASNFGFECQGGPAKKVQEATHEPCER